MQCPICDELFDEQELLSKHLEYHKNQSSLNQANKSNYVQKEKLIKPQIKIDIVNFFGKDKFEDMISKKLKNIENIEELVHRRNFVEQVKKIISKYPFVYIPYFIEDFFNGENTAKLLEKYYIQYHLDLKYIIQKTLKFNETRYQKNQYQNPFKMNMKIPDWKIKYEILRDNCEFFKNELLELTFLNILRSFILITITDYTDTGISEQNIIVKSKTLKDNFDIFRFIDKYLKQSFNEQFSLNFDNMVKMILHELQSSRIITKSRNSEMLIGKLSLDRIKQSIINELNYNHGTHNEYSIRTIIQEEYPSMLLIPGIGIWETALNELVEEKIIYCKLKTNFRNSKLIFLNENYQKIQQQLQLFGNNNIEFHGRKISPESFIFELQELEKGDFGGQDDQVTRIAGLILAESVKLQAPHEDILEFDFTTDITNYKFRDEQKIAIAKMDFQILSNIFHCKVMLDEELTLDIYEKLRNSLPRDDQGIVFTFKKPSKSVKEKLENDKSIQIIDEGGLRIWVQITPKIPARVGSIAKLHDDPISGLKRKIVKIDLVNYENGLAHVLILEDNSQATVLLRSLEEISLNEEHPKYFESFTYKYQKFLNLLMKLTTIEKLTDGIFETKTIDVIKNSKTFFVFNYKYTKTILNLDYQIKHKIFNCECLGWIEDRINLCPHLVHALDYMIREFSYLNVKWDELNNIKNALEMMIKDNISIIIDKLGIEHEEKSEQYQKMSDFIFQISRTKEM